jgi:hypothetical protein
MTRETVPTRSTPSLPSAPPIPPTTPATQVAPKRPTAMIPDAIGETTLDSRSASVSSTTVWAASSASPAAGDGGQ